MKHGVVEVCEVFWRLEIGAQEGYSWGPTRCESIREFLARRYSVRLFGLITTSRGRQFCSRAFAEGAVNILIKLPQTHCAAAMSATLGGDDYYRGTVDRNTPFVSDKLLFRMNLAWPSRGAFTYRIR